MPTAYDHELNQLVDYVTTHFPKDMQDSILIEEMSELTIELLHQKRNRPSDILMELSHVLISLMVVAKIHGITDDDIQKQISLKLNQYQSQI